MNTHKNPISLRIVAVLFVLAGIFAVIEVIVSLMYSHISLNLSVLCLWIGPGLLRHDRTWRTWALVFLWIGLIFIPLFCMIALGRDTVDFKLFGIPAGQIPAAYGIVGAIAIFLLTLWQYRVLTRPDIRQLFVSSPEPYDQPPR
jgi:hypothetical protein